MDSGRSGRVCDDAEESLSGRPMKRSAKPAHDVTDRGKGAGKRGTPDKKSIVVKAVREAVESVNTLRGVPVDGQKIAKILSGIRRSHKLKELIPIQRGDYWSIHGSMNPDSEQPTKREIVSLDGKENPDSISSEGNYCLPKEKDTEEPVIYVNANPEFGEKPLRCRKKNEDKEYTLKQRRRKERTYQKYEPPHDFYQDCLHTAEELMKGATSSKYPSGKEESQVRGSAGEEKFGVSHKKNIEVAKKMKKEAPERGEQ